MRGQLRERMRDEREGWDGRGDGMREGERIGEGGMGGVVKSDL